MDPLTTYNMIYRQFRAEADENTSLIDLAAGGGTWDNAPASKVRLYEIQEGSYVNELQLIFAGGIDAGTDPNNKTFSWKLWAWKGENCPAEYVANGVGTIGTQDVETFPDGTSESAARSWADTLRVLNQRFVRTVTSSDSTGNNEIAKLNVDTAGYPYWYVEITDADGTTGDEAGAISVWYTGF